MDDQPIPAELTRERWLKLIASAIRGKDGDDPKAVEDIVDDVEKQVAAGGRDG